MTELLTDYILEYSTRGACTCGKCINAPENPEEQQPDGHTVDMMFFKVSLKDNPSRGELKKLIEEHIGVFNEVNIFDGEEHNYMELGGWIGDQGLALMLMGMGSLLKMWKLLTPNTMMPMLDDDVKMQMAGMGSENYGK